MPNIFEELMLQNSGLTESFRPTNRKKVTESKKIKFNKIKLESRRIFEEEDFDELDAQFAVDPEEDSDEVVLVIDPDLPADEEVPEDAAEEMVGDFVYKCPVCGSNYICNCDAEKNESVEVDEDGVPTECPVCGDDAEQILVGEIAPAEDAGEEQEMDPVEVDDNETSEETEEVEDEYPEDDVVEEESVKVTEGIEDEISSEPVEVCPECGNSPCTCNDELVMEPAVDVEETAEEEHPAVEINADVVNLQLDESRLAKMMTNVIKENYKNNPSVKITKASQKNNRLKIEYVVVDGKKSKKGTLIGEGFDPKSRRMTLKFRDKGVFTENITRKPAFVVECIKVKNSIIPTKMSYDYKVRVNESLYRVYGKVGK